MWTITRRARDGSGTAPERTRLARRLRRSVGHEDRPRAREPDPVLRRGGEVELAVAGERPAVHDRHAHGPPAVAERHLRAARQRLVRDPEGARRQRPAAAEPAAVQAGAVPRRLCVAEDVQAADVLARGAGADAHRGAARLARAKVERERAARPGAVAIDRVPAAARAALEGDGLAGGSAADVPADERAAS